MPPMRVVVVTPTWNEAQNLPALLEGLRAACAGVRVVVVDDGSPDGTARRARELGRGDVQVIERAGKQGLASAYLAGFSAALAEHPDRVVQLDADLSHDPAALPELLATPAELVLGSRYVPGGAVRAWPVHRRALSRFGSWYTGLWLGGGVRDWTGGYKVWSAPLLAQVLQAPLRSEGYAFQVELTWRALALGARVVERPITFTERAQGRSKMSTRIALEAAWVVPALRLRAEDR